MMGSAFPSCPSHGRDPPGWFAPASQGDGKTWVQSSSRKGTRTKGPLAGMDRRGPKRRQQSETYCKGRWKVGESGAIHTRWMDGEWNKDTKREKRIPVIGGCIQDDLGTTTGLHMPGWSGMDGELSTAKPWTGKHNVDKTRIQPNSTCQQRVQPMHTCSTLFFHG